MLGRFVLNGEPHAVASAMLAIDGEDWSLEAALEGAHPCLRMSGTVQAPLSPGPGSLRLSFVDEPSVVVVDGVKGGLTNGGRDLLLVVRRRDDHWRIEGRVELEHFDLRFDGTGSRPLVMELELDAAMGRIHTSEA